MDTSPAYASFYQAAELWAGLLPSYDKGTEAYQNYKSNGEQVLH